jgi:dTDP-4-dehydrorhamnose reductase
MRVAIIGANGQLGTDLVARFRLDDEVLPLTRQQADVRDRPAILAALAPFRPDVVINTAAFHKVDVCEDRPWPATETNVLGTVNVARACRELGARFVHLSTDYVFSGDAARPYREDDPAEPINVYGATKLAGERLATACWPRTLVVRTSGLFGLAGARGKGGNFVETMLRLGRERGKVRVVTDQMLSPTSTSDLAVAIHQAARVDAQGILHVTNAGSCSWFDFARSIFELAGLDATVEPTTSAEFGARARRPAFSVLAHDRLRALGIAEPRPWRESLAAYLNAHQA